MYVFVSACAHVCVHARVRALRASTLLVPDASHGGALILWRALANALRELLSGTRAELMVREGLARVDDSHKLASQLTELLGKLRGEEAAARKGRYNIWQYGHCFDDEDPDL